MAAMKVVMTVDAGTHALKAGAFNVANGARVGKFITRPLIVTESGLEGRIKSQNGTELIGAMESALNEKTCELARDNGVRFPDIAAIGTSGHMHADFCLGDADSSQGDGDEGKLVPVADASMWNCQRNSAHFNLMMQSPKLRELFIKATKNEPMMRGVFNKMLWRAAEEPETWARTNLVLTTNNLLTFALTGNPVMESSDAISAFNPALTRYAAELFDFFGIANKLPQKLVKPADVVGHISYFSRLAEGRLKGTPVAAGGGDQMTGLLGNGITKKGLLGLNYGASGVVTAYDEGNHSDPKGRIHYFGDWLMACCMATGLSVDKWVEETGKSVEQIMQEAAAVPAGANGVRFYPWANGINHPVKAANTTARFVNRSSAEDLNSRAVIEGVALEMVLCAKMMKDFGLKFDMARIGGGGAKDETGLIPQTFADMLGIPVTVNEETEASSLGAAVAAAVAAGVYSSTAEACDAMVHGGKVFEPNKDNFALYEEMARQYYAQVAQDYPDAWARHNG